MSTYLQQERDFIARTKTILSQYEDYFNGKEVKGEKYEVTLLLNACVGLLILPQQKWVNNLPEVLISEQDWGIDISHIGFIKESETKTVKAVVTHLRNSLAHYNFIAFNDSNNEISEIHLLDYTNKERKTKTFDATIPVENLRRFLNKFSQFMLTQMA